MDVILLLLLYYVAVVVVDVIWMIHCSCCFPCLTDVTVLLLLISMSYAVCCWRFQCLLAVARCTTDSWRFCFV